MNSLSSVAASQVSAASLSNILKSHQTAEHSTSINHNNFFLLSEQKLPYRRCTLVY
jgi:hypothetical protein